MWQLAFFQIEGDFLFTHFQLDRCTECKAAFRVSGLMGGKLGQVSGWCRLLIAHRWAHLSQLPESSVMPAAQGQMHSTSRVSQMDGSRKIQFTMCICERNLAWFGSRLQSRWKSCLFWGDLDSYWKTGYRCLVINKAVGWPTACANATALHASSCYIWALYKLQEIIVLVVILSWWFLFIVVVNFL